MRWCCGVWLIAADIREQIASGQKAPGPTLGVARSFNADLLDYAAAAKRWRAPKRRRRVLEKSVVTLWFLHTPAGRVRRVSGNCTDGRQIGSCLCRAPQLTPGTPADPRHLMMCSHFGAENTFFLDWLGVQKRHRQNPLHHLQQLATTRS